MDITETKTLISACTRSTPDSTCTTGNGELLATLLEKKILAFFYHTLLKTLSRATETFSCPPEFSLSFSASMRRDSGYN